MPLLSLTQVAPLSPPPKVLELQPASPWEGARVPSRPWLAGVAHVPRKAFAFEEGELQEAGEGTSGVISFVKQFVRLLKNGHSEEGWAASTPCQPWLPSAAWLGLNKFCLSCCSCIAHLWHPRVLPFAPLAAMREALFCGRHEAEDGQGTERGTLWGIALPWAVPSLENLPWLALGGESPATRLPKDEQNGARLYNALFGFLRCPGKSISIQQDNPNPL